MKIRVQVTGGLGNQLFIWAGAHELQQRFNSEVSLIYIHDKNFRSDRDVELWTLLKSCRHTISIKVWRKLGIIFHIIDKFQLEKFKLSKNLLERLGIYSFNAPTSELIFEKGKPRLIRSYFQRTDIVNGSWNLWSDEVTQFLEELDVSALLLGDSYTAVHVRRGDALNFAESFGVLPVSYFQLEQKEKNPVYLCTDDFDLPSEYKSTINPSRVFNPLDSNAWQSLKIFYDSNKFVGANSTLSWWAAYFRSQKSESLTVLPRPWTIQELGFDEALFVPGVTYRTAGY